MAHKITLIPGDTTGPEVCEAVQTVVAAAGVDVAWESHPIGKEGIADALLASAAETRAVLMAFQHGGRAEGRVPPVVALRKALRIFANHRPVRSWLGMPTRFSDVDLLVIRETTEDIYAHLEHESIPNVFESFKVTTQTACERIAQHAFRTARDLGRKKLTIVHKANIMKKSDGMFLRVAQDVGRQYPDIDHDECIVDALCMRLIVDPSQFDVLLCGNLFGDIVGDLCTGLVGGASNCPSISYNEDHVALFAASHGDPEEAKGTGRANPMTLLVPAVELMRHVGENKAAVAIRAALEKTLIDDIKPHALGGRTSWVKFTEEVCGRITG